MGFFSALYQDRAKYFPNPWCKNTAEINHPSLPGSRWGIHSWRTRRSRFSCQTQKWHWGLCGCWWMGRTCLVLLKCLTFLTQISFLDLRSLSPNEFHSRTGTFPQDKVWAFVSHHFWMEKKPQHILIRKLTNICILLTGNFWNTKLRSTLAISSTSVFGFTLTMLYRDRENTATVNVKVYLQWMEKKKKDTISNHLLPVTFEHGEEIMGDRNIWQ